MKLKDQALKEPLAIVGTCVILFLSLILGLGGGDGILTVDNQLIPSGNIDMKGRYNITNVLAIDNGGIVVSFLDSISMVDYNITLKRIIPESILLEDQNASSTWWEIYEAGSTNALTFKQNGTIVLEVTEAGNIDMAGGNIDDVARVLGRETGILQIISAKNNTLDAAALRIQTTNSTDGRVTLMEFLNGDTPDINVQADLDLNNNTITDVDEIEFDSVYTRIERDGAEGLSIRTKTNGSAGANRIAISGGVASGSGEIDIFEDLDLNSNDILSVASGWFGSTNNTHTGGTEIGIDSTTTGDSNLGFYKNGSKRSQINGWDNSQQKFEISVWNGTALWDRLHILEAGAIKILNGDLDINQNDITGLEKLRGDLDSDDYIDFDSSGIAVFTNYSGTPTRRMVFQEGESGVVDIDVENANLDLNDNDVRGVEAVIGTTFLNLKAGSNVSDVIIRDFDDNIQLQFDTDVDKALFNMQIDLENNSITDVWCIGINNESGASFTLKMVGTTLTSAAGTC